MKMTPSTMSPLEAYEALMLFARRRGEGALRLAMHAAVPQSFRPDLLHLLKLNFLPRELHDPAAEADVLFSPLCEEVGRGYFEFGPHVRTLLLDNLAANYAADRTPRISRVANFLLFYVEQMERRAAGSLDRLWRDYLEVQRWVALAFLDPDTAARQLAAALKGISTPGGEFAARLRLGGLASALSSPLVKYRHVLNYAAGLQALEAGDHARARTLLSGLGDEEIEVGGVRLRPATDLLRDYAAQSPEPAPPPVAPADTEAGAFSEQVQAEHSASELLDALLRARGSEEKVSAIGALKGIDEPPVLEALINAVWYDEDSRVRLAAVNALSKSTNETALDTLLFAAGDMDVEVHRTASEALRHALGGNGVLIFGFFGTDHVENRKVLREELRRRGYVPLLFPYTRPPIRNTADIVRAVTHLVSFAVVDLTAPPEIQEEIRHILELFLSQTSLPLLPIYQGVMLSKLPIELREQYPSVLPLYSYAGPGELREAFDRIVIEPVSAKLVGTEAASDAPSTSYLDHQLGQATALADAGSLEEALGAYEEAARLFPQDVRPRVGRGEMLWRMGNLLEALEAYRSAFDLVVVQNNFPEQARLTLNLGQLCQQLGQVEEAREFYNQGRATFERLGDKSGRATALYGLGVLSLQMTHYHEALSLFEECLALRKESGDIRGEAMTLYYLSRTQLRLDRPEEALDIFRHSLKIFTELDDLRGQSLVLDSMGWALERLGRVEEALEVLRRRLEIEEKLGDQGSVALALNNLGGLLQRMGSFDEARDTFERSYSICRELGDVPGMAAALKGRGSVFEALKNVEAAMAAYQEVLHLLPDDEEAQQRLKMMSRSEDPTHGPSEVA